jgi:hypothetical protein
MVTTRSWNILQDLIFTLSTDPDHLITLDELGLPELNTLQEFVKHLKSYLDLSEFAGDNIKFYKFNWSNKKCDTNNIEINSMAFGY